MNILAYIFYVMVALTTLRGSLAFKKDVVYWKTEAKSKIDFKALFLYFKKLLRG